MIVGHAPLDNDIDLCVMRSRWAWLTFHGPVIVLYIFKTIWWMNVILCDNESVGHDLWPQNECRSQWPIFHGPVILLYVLKTIWLINIILWYNESDITFELIVNVGHSDLYFMVHWFCFISSRVLDGIISSFGIMSQWDMTSDLIINVGHSDLYSIFHGPLILLYIFKSTWWNNIIIWDNESVRHDLRPHNKCRSQWPIFYISWSIDFVLYLEGYLMDEHHTLW